MTTVVVLALFVLAIALLTHDRDGLDFAARDRRRTLAAREHRSGRVGTVVP